MTDFITIVNNGPEIASTNYWSSPAALRGALFLSWNAGVARVLVPAAMSGVVPEMKTGDEIIISRGPCVEMGGREAWELLFEDNSDTSFSVMIVSEQSDRLIPDDQQGSGFDVAIWTETGRQFTRPGKYRRVDSLPCLLLWVEQ